MITASHHMAAMRDAAPLVQNITNFVAMNIMANVLLAAGASPAMVHARSEAAEFAGLADAICINIGTLDTEWVASMELAARAANDNGKAWVLDPVAAGATAFRRDTCAELLALKPAVIRGNASEILALSGQRAKGRGADSADPVAAAHAGARHLARTRGAVVAVTGPIDYVTDGTRAAQIANGHPMMPRVTALGCALTGLIAAYVATSDTYAGTIAALACYGVAGERAAKAAAGPGSFQPAFLDALYIMSDDDLDAGARITPA